LIKNVDLSSSFNDDGCWQVLSSCRREQASESGSDSRQVDHNDDWRSRGK